MYKRQKQDKRLLECARSSFMRMVSANIPARVRSYTVKIAYKNLHFDSSAEASIVFQIDFLYFSQIETAHSPWHSSRESKARQAGVMVPPRARSSASACSRRRSWAQSVPAPILAAKNLQNLFFCEQHPSATSESRHRVIIVHTICSYCSKNTVGIVRFSRPTGS